MTKARYEVTLYHDTETDAAADNKTLPPEPLYGAKSAIADAQRHLDAYWQTATIDIGEMERDEVEPGIYIERFVAEEGRGWYVGPGWAETR